MREKILMLIGLIAVILLSGYIQKKSEENPAINACMSLCKDRLDSGGDPNLPLANWAQPEQSSGLGLSNGPCLSNDIYPDWVCDVAHSPRQLVDNIPENQCPSFREGKMHHFVEVDENCNFIRAV